MNSPKSTADRTRIEFTVLEDFENLSMEKYLRSRKKLSAKAVRRLKHHGIVLLNGNNALMKDVVNKGDIIELFYPPEKVSPYLRPQSMELNIIYEDSDFIVIDKPAGICVHPNKNHPEDTLANGVLYHLQEQGINATAHFVNRLDKDTSGIVLLAKSNYSAQQFYHQQEKSQIKRKYQALVWGNMTEEYGTIKLPLQKEEGRTTKRYVDMAGKNAITKYRIIKRYKEFTYLEIVLDTGRTHQIRAHLFHTGFPLVGDAIYGKKDAAGERLGVVSKLKRQFLHAYQISFKHPRNGELLEYVSPLAKDLQETLNHLHNFLYTEG